MKRKYLDDLGVPEKERPESFFKGKKDEREPKWKEQRKIYGFDVKEVWNLDYTFYLWLYERLMMYRETACCDLSFHKFQIDGEELTQGECIDRMIDYLKIAIINGTCYLDDEEEEKVYSIGKIWAEVLPAMWW